MLLTRLVIAGDLEHLALDVEHLAGLLVSDALELFRFGGLAGLKNPLLAPVVSGLAG